MKLQILENISDREWDSLISKFETCSLFHQSAWLKFIQETQKVKILQFQILENNKML